MGQQVVDILVRFGVGLMEQVGHGHSHRARDPRNTVDQDITAVAAGVVNKAVHNGKVFDNILLVVVINLDVEVAEVGWHGDLIIIGGHGW